MDVHARPACAREGVLAMPEEDFIAKHAPAGDHVTAEAFREIYREVVEESGRGRSLSSGCAGPGNRSVQAEPARWPGSESLGGLGGSFGSSS